MSLLYIIIIAIFSIILCIAEIPPMLKSKDMMDFWAFSLLLALGVTVMVLRAVNVKVPNPSNLISYIYSPISEFLAEFLK